MPKQAVVIQHIAFEDLGNLAPVLQQHSYTIEYLQAGVAPLSLLDPLKPELIIMLGGPIGVYDQADFPFLNDEIQLLQRRLAADLPTLGICLGAQLMASALGARVYPGHSKEIGWAPLQLTAAGKQSPLAHLSGEQTNMFHWHGDTFDLPTDTTLLASSTAYSNQAFRIGKHGLALQFHPEITPTALEPWLIGNSAEIAHLPHLSVKQIREQSKQYLPTLQTQAAQCWHDWLKVIQPH